MLGGRDAVKMREGMMAIACKCLNMNCPIFNVSEMRVSLLEHFAFSSDDELYEICRVTGACLEVLQQRRDRAWNHCVNNDGKRFKASPVLDLMF